MLIANPIYDSVFKYLLEDTDIAKGLLSVILEEEIVELVLKPQEYTQHSPTFLLTVVRMDFHARIRTKTGEYKTVLIELQKGKELLDMMRFRTYLAENYKRSEQIDGKEAILPIITLYFLGFLLQQVKVPVLKVNRVYTDVMTREELRDIKEPFIEQLTHDCYIIQIRRLSSDLQTKLARVLSIFNQDFITSDRRILDVPEQPEDPLTRQMLQRLTKAIASEQLRQTMDAEEGIEKAIIRALKEKEAEAELLLAEKEQALAEKDSMIAEKEEALAEKDSMIAEKEEALAEKDSMIAEKEEALAEKDSMIAEKEQALAEKDSMIAEKEEALAEKDSMIAEKEQALAEKDTIIAELRKRLGL